MTDTINNQIPFVPENTIDPAAGLNLSLNTIDALLQVLVQSVGENSPPAGVEGQCFVVGASPTGLWAGQANKLARFLDGAWQFFDARYALNAADGAIWVRSDSEWSAIAGEWSAETVSQVEAEEGAATTRRAWTSLRVRQAVAAWWLTVSTAFGRSLVGASDAPAARSALSLGTAAISDLTANAYDATAGRVMKVGDYGLPVAGAYGELASQADLNNYLGSGFWATPSSGLVNIPPGWPQTRLQLQVGGGPTYATQMVMDTGTGGDALRVAARRMRGAGIFNTWREFWHTGNLNPNQLSSFTIATLPSAAANPRLQVYVSNLAGQAAPVFSDGTNWRRVSDNTIAN